MKTKIAAAIYFAALAAIVVLADIPRTQPLFQPIRNLPLGDKWGHFLLMGGFSFTANLALGARSIRIRHTEARPAIAREILLGSLIVFAIVAGEEFSQIFIPGRTFDLVDLAADAAGIFGFGELARRLLRRFETRLHSCH